MSAISPRVLEILRAAAPEPVSYEDLKRSGIQQPAQAIYELELAGHLIEHTAHGVRLGDDALGRRDR